LQVRGSLTVWFAAGAIAAWRTVARTTRGGQTHYSDLAIVKALTPCAVFRRALRQIEGLIGSILQLLGLDLTVPDHSTMSRRAKSLELPRMRSGRRPMHLLADSTGLRLCGPGDLLDSYGGPIASFTADGAYDRDDNYAAVAARSRRAAVVIPPRSSAVISTADSAPPTQRDRHIAAIAKHGRMGWQRRSGYNRRAFAEADVSRWKRIVADGLRSRTDDRQSTKVAIEACALKRMLELVRPEYLRIA
jgi:hypothetical protein